jgi:hypothetical protein
MDISLIEKKMKQIHVEICEALNKNTKENSKKWQSVKESGRTSRAEKILQLELLFFDYKSEVPNYRTLFASELMPRMEANQVDWVYDFFLKCEIIDIEKANNTEHVNFKIPECDAADSGVEIEDARFEYFDSQCLYESLISRIRLPQQPEDMSIEHVYKEKAVAESWCDRYDLQNGFKADFLKSVLNFLSTLSIATRLNCSEWFEGTTRQKLADILTLFPDGEKANVNAASIDGTVKEKLHEIFGSMASSVVSAPVYVCHDDHVKIVGRLALSLHVRSSDADFRAASVQAQELLRYASFKLGYLLSSHASAVDISAENKGGKNDPSLDSPYNISVRFQQFFGRIFQLLPENKQGLLLTEWQKNLSKSDASSEADLRKVQIEKWKDLWRPNGMIDQFLEILKSKLEASQNESVERRIIAALLMSDFPKGTSLIDSVPPQQFSSIPTFRNLLQKLSKGKKRNDYK